LGGAAPRRFRAKRRSTPKHVRRRLVVKPGLTGLWQVNGRSDLSWDESVRLDLRYVENWSFALELADPVEGRSPCCSGDRGAY